MAALKPLLSSFTNHQIKVWVLAPLLETNDANIDYYYDFSQYWHRWFLKAVPVPKL